MSAEPVQVIEFPEPNGFWESPEHWVATKPILTSNQKRSIKRRNVGQLDDGRPAFPVHKGDIEEMARAIFERYDDALIFKGNQELVDWCPHTADYVYQHGCDEWCENPRPRMVWVAQYAKT